jgi:hypothetical protein
VPAGVPWIGAGRWVTKDGDGTAAASRWVEWLADGMGGGLLAVGKDRDDGGVRAVDEIGTMLEQVLTRVRQVQELLFHTRVIPHLTAHPMHCGPAVSAVWHVSRCCCPPQSAESNGTTPPRSTRCGRIAWRVCRAHRTYSMTRGIQRTAAQSCISGGLPDLQQPWQHFLV